MVHRRKKLTIELNLIEKTKGGWRGGGNSKERNQYV